MSAITIHNDLVHYEVLGRGRPVILLHGWLGSWRYWVPAMRQLSMQYRVYALDLWGFGDTAHDSEHYSFEAQVDLLDRFMGQLGIEKAALVGHDLGAAVVARYAADNPTRIPRLMTISPPLFRFAPSAAAPALPSGTTDSSPSRPSAPAMTEAETMVQPPPNRDERIKAAIEQRTTNKDSRPSNPLNPNVLRAATTPPTDQPAHEIAPGNANGPTPSGGALTGDVQGPNPLRDHMQIFDALQLLDRHVDAGGDLDKLKAEAGKAAKDVIETNVNSFNHPGADTFKCLQGLPMQIVLLYGTHDSFVPPPQPAMVTELKDAAPHLHEIKIDGIKHFPMLEAIDDFSSLLLEFLEIPDVKRLKIKKTWERRVR
ncbi:MAG: alpha/beta hydrolase [Anaerolineae bacterium]|nr:alpha/beta hydrolase [Anaerolineae bacterium]